MTSYHLTEEGITFFVDGIIVFDCPIDRIRKEPEKAIMALNLLENVWKTRYEILNLKGGDM